MKKAGHRTLLTGKEHVTSGCKAGGYCKLLRETSGVGHEGGRCTPGRRRGGGKQHSQVGKGGGGGGKEGNYATLRNVSQSKKCKEAGVNKYRAGTGIKGYGNREVKTPSPPPPPAKGLNISITVQEGRPRWSQVAIFSLYIQLLCFERNLYNIGVSLRMA